MNRKLKSKEDYLVHLYIHMNDADQFVIFNGLSMKQMLMYMGDFSNLLLLKHQYDESSFNLHTQFDYIERAERVELMKSLETATGDFCFVDFKDERYMNQLSPTEQAELLYFSHKKEPLNSAFSVKLQNNYLYYYTSSNGESKIYFRYLENCEIIVAALINYSIRERQAIGSFFRRKSKKVAPTISKDQLKPFRGIAKEGALVSLYKYDKPNATYGLEIRAVAEIDFSEEVWENLNVLLKQPFDEHIQIS